MRLARTTIEHLPWDECVRRYDRDGTVFYCDPPYWSTEGYGNEFALKEYSRMADLARSIKGRMVISVNDIPEMREAFSGLHIDRLSLHHQVGGGAGVNRGELLIQSRPL